MQRKFCSFKAQQRSNLLSLTANKHQLKAARGSKTCAALQVKLKWQQQGAAEHVLHCKSY
jgi:hypothetical protein